MTGNTLIVGYGNPLRGDDGVGQAVAQAFADDTAIDGVEAIACHQLTPLNSPNGSPLRREFVLIDAAVGREAGGVSVVSLQPAPTPLSNLGHHVEPSQLLRLAQRLYGRSPEAYLVTVGAHSLALGEVRARRRSRRRCPRSSRTVRRSALKRRPEV